MQSHDSSGLSSLKQHQDTPAQPLNTIVRTQDSLEEGLTRATAEEQTYAG
jgi:hypothetical protein